MPAVKPLDRISRKWANASAAALTEYEEGVRNPRRDWADATSKANDAYKKGIQASIAADRFKKGVTNAGTGKWQEQTLRKGPSRWSEGIALSTDAYERGFTPYRNVIERTELPARGPKGDPGNIQRVAILSKALHDEKMSRGR